MQKYPFIPVRDFLFILWKYLHFICFVENLRTSLRKIYRHVPPGINGYFFIWKPIYFNGNGYFCIRKLLHFKGNRHSFRKHGFFSLKQFLSHITKFLRGFWSSGIFPFTGFIERDFSIHRYFFFPLAGFFIHFDWNLWSLFKIRRFLKKLLEDFSLLVKKN